MTTAGERIRDEPFSVTGTVEPLKPREQRATAKAREPDRRWALDARHRAPLDSFAKGSPRPGCPPRGQGLTASARRCPATASTPRVAAAQFERFGAPTVVVPIAYHGHTGVFYVSYRGDDEWMEQARLKRTSRT